MTTIKINDFPRYRVAAAREQVAKAHARLVRASKKIGQIPPTAPQIVVTGERLETRCVACPGEAGKAMQRLVVDLEVIIERPCLGGWEFLAVVEPLDGGNLIRQVPGAIVADGELGMWRQGAIVCDCCGVSRKRRETFIVRQGATYKQVGRNCLEVFLPGACTAAIAAAFTWEQVIRATGEDDEQDWGHKATVVDSTEFLARVVCIIRQKGWVSGAEARNSSKRSTADEAFYASAQPDRTDIARAQISLDWARNLVATNDYERNLVLVAHQQDITSDHAGILASALVAYDRATSCIELPTNSQHVGKIGQRVDLDLVVDRVVEMASDYGPLRILAMHDATGNKFVWKTGRAGSGGKAGDRVKLRGTIKEHNEFRGTAQTILARCVVAEWCVALEK